MNSNRTVARSPVRRTPCGWSISIILTVCRTACRFVSFQVPLFTCGLTPQCSMALRIMRTISNIAGEYVNLPGSSSEVLYYDCRCREISLHIQRERAYYRINTWPSNCVIAIHNCKFILIKPFRSTDLSVERPSLVQEPFPCELLHDVFVLVPEIHIDLLQLEKLQHYEESKQHQVYRTIVSSAAPTVFVACSWWQWFDSSRLNPDLIVQSRPSWQSQNSGFRWPQFPRTAQTRPQW